MTLKGWSSLFVSVFYGCIVLSGIYYIKRSSKDEAVREHIKNHVCDMEVFSHRGALIDDKAPGSIESVTDLMQHGICSFDVDCFKTSDNELVIGHPLEMMKRLKLEQSPDTLTLKELLKISSQTSTVYDFLRIANELKSECYFVNKKQSHKGDLRVLIEPKGSSASIETVLSIAGMATEFNYLQGEVGLWLTELGVAVKTHGTLLKSLAPIKNGFDSPVNGKVFAAVGPSVFNDQLVDVVRDARKQDQSVLVWVVDRPDELDIISELEISAIISNQPIAMKKHISHRCTKP